MKLPVLVESANGRGFIARLGPPFDWSAEGATEVEALANLEKETARQAARGRYVAFIEAPGGVHPLLKFAGDWKGDPMVADFQKAVEELRRQRDLEDEVIDDAAVPH